MKTRSMILAVSLSLLGLLGSTGAAHAAPLHSDTVEQAQVRTVDTELTPELEAYLATLSPTEREEFVNTSLPATEKIKKGKAVPLDDAAKQSLTAAQLQGESVSIMATGCWTARVDWTQHATFGNALYSYYHVGGWCSSGTSITSAWTAASGGQTYTVGWRYDGRIGQSSGVISNQGRSYTQHKFVLGSGGWDVQTRYDCGRIGGLYTAGYVYSTTCGIY